MRDFCYIFCPANYVFDWYLKKHNLIRKEYIHVHSEKAIRGIEKANLILLSGWRYYNSILWEHVIENLMRANGCNVIGNFSDITENEKERFKILRLFYLRENNLSEVEETEEISISRYELMILDD